MAKVKAAPDPTDKEIAAATRRGQRTKRAGLLATEARYDASNKRIIIELSSGFSIGIPIAKFPEVADASSEELEDVDILGAGGILRWESLDQDYSIPALVLSALGADTAKSELARIAGSAKSKAKAAAARANGSKGGRPRKLVKA